MRPICWLHISDIHMRVIKRECLDHVIVFSKAHLRRILRSYADYHNKVRMRRSLDKDAPSYRPVQRVRKVVSQPILGGPHHRCVPI